MDQKNAWLSYYEKTWNKNSQVTIMEIVQKKKKSEKENMQEKVQGINKKKNICADLLRSKKVKFSEFVKWIWETLCYFNFLH